MGRAKGRGKLIAMPSNGIGSHLSPSWRSIDPTCLFLFLFSRRFRLISSPIGRSLSLPVVVRHRPHGRLEVGRRLLLYLVGERVDLEAIEPRHELVGRPLWPVLWVHHEQHVREPGAEVRAIGVVVPATIDTWS